MLLLSWVLLALAGRVVVFVWQKFPEKYLPTKFVKEIHACDLCSGVWLYPIVFWSQGIGIVNALLYGIVTAFVVWVFVKGIKTLIEPTTLIIK